MEERTFSEDFVQSTASQIAEKSAFKRFVSGHDFSRAEPQRTKTWPLGPEAKIE
jgi:hypothetical protein